MNYRLLSKYLGHFSAAIGLLMLPSALWAVYFHEWQSLGSVLLSVTFSIAFGGLLAAAGRNASPVLRQREALCFVSVSWLIAAGLGALPFIFAGILGPVDAYFECMSGFTTTGSSVLTDIEATPKSILFWRSFTHWLGGMGIVVLFIAVLPYLGAGGKQLFRHESPGPNPQGIKPRIKDTAAILYKIYLGFTVAQTAALMLAGMSLFDALCHTFGTLGTGGYSTRQASIAAYDSALVDAIIVFFMVCAGANFAIYFSVLRGDWKAPWRDTEWRVYVGIMTACTILVTANLMGLGGDVHTPYTTWSGAFRHASFQVVSIMTTTGFCTADFDVWPQFSRMLLVTLMFVGGCAGSTGGGIKVVRFVVLLKMGILRLEKTFRPKAIQAARISGAVVDRDIQSTIQSFFALYVLVFVAASLVMALLGLPFQTAATSVAATLNNIGPGLELVGATRDFSSIPQAGKVILSLCMVLGRLELFSILVLLMPSFWRNR